MDGEVSFASGAHAPIGVHIDARGAYIEYDGSSWAFTNDNTGHEGSALRGGMVGLCGGFWRAMGEPDGFVRPIDCIGSHIYPQLTRDWNNGANDCAVYQLGEGTRWCESNHFGGLHHLPNIGMRSVGSSGGSFQDNFIDNIHVSEVKEMPLTSRVTGSSVRFSIQPVSLVLKLLSFSGRTVT